jgi:hypothetical protein
MSSAEANKPLFRLTSGSATRRTLAIYNLPLAAGCCCRRTDSKALLVFFLNAAFFILVALLQPVTRCIHNIPFQYFTGFFIGRNLEQHTLSSTDNAAFILSQRQSGKQQKKNHQFFHSSTPFQSKVFPFIKS